MTALRPSRPLLFCALLLAALLLPPPPPGPLPPAACALCGPGNPYLGEDTLLLVDTLTLEWVNVGPRLRQDGPTAPSDTPHPQDFDSAHTPLVLNPGRACSGPRQIYRAGPPFSLLVLLGEGRRGDYAASALIQQNQNTLLTLYCGAPAPRESALSARCCPSCASLLAAPGRRFLLYDCLGGAACPLPSGGQPLTLRSFRCELLYNQTYLLSFPQRR